MGKAFAMVMALILFMTVLMFDVQATQKHFYNNGVHGDCGGQWVHCERDRTGHWFYCDRCGHQKKF